MNQIPSFVIEPASWRDLNRLRQIERECFKDDAWPLLDLIAVLTIPAVVRLKAVEVTEGEMVGFIAGDRRQHEQLGWITTLCVVEAYRRQGIALALLEACERTLNMRSVRLSVRRSNLGAIRLYERADYHLHTVWPNYYPGGEDALVLEKKYSIPDAL